MEAVYSQREATVSTLLLGPMTNRADEDMTADIAKNEIQAATMLREHGIVPIAQLQSFICVLEECRRKFPFQRKLFTKYLKKRAHNALIVYGIVLLCAQVGSEKVVPVR